MGKMRPDYYDSTFTANFLAPGDVATIYDINPLYNATSPIDGTGQKLAIIGQTDVYLADIANFRTGFSLNPITGCTTNSTGIITACNSTNFQYVAVGTDPGIVYPCGDLGESDLDIEWSGAVARNAQIIFVNSPIVYDVNNNCAYVSGGGVNTALIAAIDPSTGPVLAPVVSMSYGICELEAEDLEAMLQQGNAEGVTIMNSSDDIGSAGCDFNPPNNEQPFLGAVGGLAVSYPASSPEVTGVGGTEITIANDDSSTYWSTSTSPTGGSVNEYIPEIPWNDNEELALFCQSESTQKFCLQGGSSPQPGWVPLGVSATAAQVQQDIWISQGGGGASNCWTESNSGICSAGFAQPTWQQTLTVPGAPAGVRYVPDVSMMASPNFPGYIYCTQISELEGSGTGSSCGSGGAAGITTSVNTYQSLVGGTSVASPVFAGIVTLLNQYLAGPSSAGLGNINSELYTFAATPSNNVFHPVTTGDNNVYCQKNQPSSQPVALQCPTAGVMGYSASLANSDPTTGYNLVNGLGSVDVNNLAVTWAGSRTATTTAISTPSGNANQGDTVTFTATVIPWPSNAKGSASFYNNGSTTALGAATVSNGTATFSTTALPAGTDSVVAVYNGSGTQSGSTSPAPAVVTVVAPDFMLTANGNLSPTSVPAGQSASVTLTIAPVTGSASITFSASSCTGLPAGATCSFNPATVTFGGVSGTATTVMTVSTAANMALPSGAQNITVTGTVGSTSHTAQVSVTVVATNQTFAIAATTSSFSVAPGASAAVQIGVTGTNGFIIGSGSTSTTALPLTYTCASGLPSEAFCNFTPTGGTAVSTTAVTLNITTTAPTAQLHPPLERGNRIFYAMLLPGLFGILLVAGGSKRHSRLLGLIVVLGISTLWLGSCGGSSGGGGTKNPGTPAGTYPIVVNTTTGAPAGGTALTGTFTVNLTVQ